MKRWLYGLIGVALGVVAVAATDGPLTPLMNVPARTDSNGYLLVVGGAMGAAQTPLTPMGNLLGRSDSNGYLVVALTGGNVSGQLKLADGTAAAPSLTFASDTDTGIYSASANGMAFSAGGTPVVRILSTPALNLAATTVISWGSSGFTSADLLLNRGGAGILEQKNADNAQEFRVYGATTGAKYTKVSHNGTNGFVSASAGSLYIDDAGGAEAIYLRPGTSGVQISGASGRDLKWVTDGGGSIGAAGANRPDKVYVKTGYYIGASAGCTGTPTTTTAGIATTCTGPEYAPDALMARILQLEAQVAALTAQARQASIH